jgi:hypothetical protein
MSYVIAIDVGIKNLGLCVFDFRTSKVVAWENVSLVPNGRYIPANNVQYVRDFVQRFTQYFENAFQVIIERQIRCNMRIVESVLQSMFFDRCQIISARSVKVHYDLSTKNYRLNKQKAVDWAKRFVQHNPGAFVDELAADAFGKAAKQDDLADSLLLVMYYLNTYSNHLTSACTLYEFFSAPVLDDV